MWKNKLTLMLIPNSRERLKQLRVPVALLYFAGGSLLLLVLFSFFFSAEFFNGQVDQKELESLRAENQQLRENYEQMRWYLAEVESRYDELVAKEIHLRSLFDLPTIEPQQRQLGVGGPMPPAQASMSETEIAAVASEREVEHLLKLSEFEVQKYTEVEDALVDLKDRLNHTPSIWPTTGWVSRNYGMKYDPFTGYKQMHRGVDIANHRGTPVIATARGRVARTGSNGGMGKTVVIDHGYGFTTRYAHLSEIKVKSGQTVQRGEVIGLIGSTGYSTGPHLHYEVSRNGKSMNPMNYILNEM
jgi:murein DD-endopeptidase MepM/ murein hydrolase activator NlpD